MADCIFFTSGICFKSEAQLAQTSAGITLWASGNCLPCLTAMSFAGYNNQMIPILRPGVSLMSGSRVQFNL